VYKNRLISHKEFTQELAIQREEDGQFIIWIQQKTTTDNIPSGNVPWPFNLLSLSRETAFVSRNAIRIWRGTNAFEKLGEKSYRKKGNK
jgi:hypothetical protein